VVVQASVLVDTRRRRAVGHCEREPSRDLGRRHLPRSPQPPLDRLLEHEPRGRRRRKGERCPERPRSVELPEHLSQLAAQRDKQGDRAAGVQGDLERLAKLGVEVHVGRVEQRRDEREVT